MKNILIILFFSSMLSSCFLKKGSHSVVKSYKIQKDYGDGSTSQIRKDTSVINYARRDSLLANWWNTVKLDSAQRQHGMILVSSEGYGRGSSGSYGRGSVAPNYGKLKIMTVTNTKVVNKTVNMSDGRVVYKIPAQMKFRSRNNVLLRITKSKATLSVYDNLDGEVMTSEIPVTQTMSVNLIDLSPADDKAFEITTGDNAVQVVDSGDTYTQWTWNVTPIKVGNAKLQIVVAVVRDGGEKDMVYEDTVEVQNDIPTQLLLFWNKYWQWIIGTFLLPFFLWMYKRKNDKDKKDKA
jgi:hypothetical protein